MKITEHEMRGLLAGKCLPGDMRLNEDLPSYLVRKVDELQRKLEAADSLANFRGAMINDLLRTTMPENIADIIDSGDLEAICYGHEYPGAEKHRMALFNFRMVRRSEARDLSDLIRSGTHDTADKAG